MEDMVISNYVSYKLMDVTYTIAVNIDTTQLSITVIENIFSDRKENLNSVSNTSDYSKKRCLNACTYIWKGLQWGHWCIVCSV